MDQPFLTWKVPASTRSSRSGLQAYSSTHRRRKWAQPDLCKHIGKDGPQLYESAYSKQGSVLWHRFWKLFYTNWLGHPPSHIWYRTELPDRVHQIRSSRLRVLLPCYLGKTCTSQVHGSATLCLHAPQDARQHRSPFTTGRPPQVLRVRQGSNRSCFYYLGP